MTRARRSSSSMTRMRMGRPRGDRWKLLYAGSEPVASWLGGYGGPRTRTEAQQAIETEEYYHGSSRQVERARPRHPRVCSSAEAVQQCHSIQRKGEPMQDAPGSLADHPPDGEAGANDDRELAGHNAQARPWLVPPARERHQ